jgi:hypothetical protein
MRRVHAVSDGCLSRQRYPYDLLSQHLRSAGADPQRLLRWFVNFIPSVSGGADEPTVERYSPGADLAELNFKINPNQRPRSAPLQLCVDARTALYGEQDIRTLFARVEALARQVLVRADEPLSRLDRITAAERSAPGDRRTVRAGIYGSRADAEDLRRRLDLLDARASGFWSTGVSAYHRFRHGHADPRRVRGASPPRQLHPGGPSPARGF